MAQSDLPFSQYMFNGLVVNPAIAGSKEEISAAFLYRKQWIGIGNAPVIQSFSIHSPFQYQKIGLGMLVTNESFSIQNRLSASACYAYKINFAKGILSFGISGGIIQTSIKYSELTVTEEEKSYLKNNLNEILPDVGAGLYYQNRNFYLGLSGLHLLFSSFNYSNYTLQEELIKKHFYLMAGYRLKVSDKLQILPSALVKYAVDNYFQADFTTHIKYNDMIWGGFSVRTSQIYSFQAGLKLSDIFNLPSQSIRMGYAFDWSDNALKFASQGSHELMLIFDIGIYEKPSKIRKRKINISPVLF